RHPTLCYRIYYPSYSIVEYKQNELSKRLEVRPMNTTGMYNEIQAALKRGERIAVATVVKTIGAAPCGVGTKMLVRADGATSGSFSGSRVDTQVAQMAMQALREGQSNIAHVHLDPDQAVGSCGATLELFIEVLYPEP